jgi:hypothetical protein
VRGDVAHCHSKFAAPPAGLALPTDNYCREVREKEKNTAKYGHYKQSYKSQPNAHYVNVILFDNVKFQ